MKRLILAFASFCFAHAAYSADYDIDYSQSSITFAGEHAGDAFDGVFKTWQGTIVFDPADLAASSFDIAIDTASAETGNAMYDGTLPQADWFAVKEHPKAHFKTTVITPKNTGCYRAEGTLTIRGITKPVAFDFTLEPADASSSPVKASASFRIKRLDYDIGKGSDAEAEWVSNPIDITLSILAATR